MEISSKNQQILNQWNLTKKNINKNNKLFSICWILLNLKQDTSDFFNRFFFPTLLILFIHLYELSFIFQRVSIARTYNELVNDYRNRGKLSDYFLGKLWFMVFRKKSSIQKEKYIISQLCIRWNGLDVSIPQNLITNIIYNWNNSIKNLLRPTDNLSKNFGANILSHSSQSLSKVQTNFG